MSRTPRRRTLGRCWCRGSRRPWPPRGTPPASGVPPAPPPYSRRPPTRRRRRQLPPSCSQSHPLSPSLPSPFSLSPFTPLPKCARDQVLPSSLPALPSLPPSLVPISSPPVLPDVPVLDAPLLALSLSLSLPCSIRRFSAPARRASWSTSSTPTHLVSQVVSPIPLISLPPSAGCHGLNRRRSPRGRQSALHRRGRRAAGTPRARVDAPGTVGGAGEYAHAFTIAQTRCRATPIMARLYLTLGSEARADGVCLPVRALCFLSGARQWTPLVLTATGVYRGGFVFTVPLTSACRMFTCTSLSERDAHTSHAPPHPSHAQTCTPCLKHRPPAPPTSHRPPPRTRMHSPPRTRMHV